MSKIVTSLLACMHMASLVHAITYTVAVSPLPLRDAMRLAGTPSQSYASTALTLDSFISNTDLSTAMSTALGSPATAVASAQCTLVVLYGETPIADANAVAMRLAVAAGVATVPFHTTSRDVRFIVPRIMSVAAAAAAMGRSAVGTAAVVCIDVHMGAATPQRDIESAMAMHPWHVAAIVG